MKKVKIMLISALVAASVGGALAFKVVNKSPWLFCGTTIDSCPFVDYIHNYTTAGADENHKVDGLYCTAGLQEGDCTYVTFE